jgi:hypothetical protein
MAVLLVVVLAATPALAADPSPAAGSPGASSVPTGSAASPGASPGASASPSPTQAPVLPSMGPVPPLAQPGPALTREVVAYLPYWVAQSPTTPWDPDTEPWITEGRLTDLVLFSVGVGKDGSLRLDEPGAAFILGPAGTAAITAAHARGIRVLVSFTSFGRARNEALLGRNTAIDRFAQQAAALVAARGLDGADLDVEQLPSDRFAGYGRMVRRVTEELRATDPEARITAATNGNRSGARMAARAIRSGADRVFLMGYAYRGPKSPVTGSIAPIVRVDGGLGLQDSLDLYRGRDVPLDQVIVGLPAYGMTWATDGPGLHAHRAPASVSERGATTLFRSVAAPPGAIDVSQDEDPLEGSARLTWYQPDRRSWFQTYYDTPATLRAKYLLAHAEGLAGVGMWTLGYDTGDTGYPALVDDLFARPVLDAVGVAADGDPVVHITALAYPGLAPTNGVRISNDGTAWSDWLDATALDPNGKGLAWQLADGPDGPRTIHLQLGDKAGTLSVPVVVTTALDRSPPAIEGPSLRPAPVLGGWIVLVTAHDAGGVASTELRWKVGDAPFGDWRELDSLAAATMSGRVEQPVEVEVRVTDTVGHVTTGSATAAVGTWTRP